MKISLKHIKKYTTILRYFDLQSIIDCILFINKKIKISENFKIENYFNELYDINTISIKQYYLHLLKFNKRSFVLKPKKLRYKPLYYARPEKQDPNLSLKSMSVKKPGMNITL